MKINFLINRVVYKIYELWLFYNSRLLQLHTNNQMGDHSISLRLVKENGHDGKLRTQGQGKRNMLGENLYVFI